ncbi:Nitric oxide-responding transcriptional regulator Dnr (Crp/Fnr family) [uncultured Candidatus Thioglobus sp.]|nr:Nitric oxide-responding transcriptional regulator Dnr (Crp/Fnr family) [uncultured Candidatus Thioglobus sp.]
MLSAEHQKILQANALFSGFTEDELAQISRFSAFVEVENQQRLFEQGQIAKYFFLLVSGKIKLAFLSAEGLEKVVDVIQPGHSFAEAVMFFRQRKYPLNASALGHSGVLRVNTGCYLKILESSTKSCFKIMGKLSQRLHWATSEINHLVLHDGKYRLIKFLLANAKKSNNVDLSIAKNILASQLSIKPETLSRTLNELSKQGLIAVDSSHIVLLKPSELEDIIIS